MFAEISSIVGQYSIFAVLLFLGIFASKISSWIRIPTLLMILIIGMLVGQDGFKIIEFQDNYDLAVRIGTLALVFILFSGGYDTSWGSIRKVLLTGTILSTFGVFMTALLVGFFASWLFGWNWKYGLLLGSIISSTDAAAVFALFRSQSSSLKGNLRPILEYESGSNDPMAAFLTLFMIDLILGKVDSPASFFYLMPLRIGVGTLVGYLIGKAVARLMNHAKLEYDGLYYVTGIATVFLAYGVSELLQGNGFMAVYVCGVTMGNHRFIFKHGLGRFHDGLAWLMQVTLFLSLGLLVTPSDLPQIALKGTLLAVFLMFVARPATIFLSLLFSKFNFRDKLLISWGGIRGAAPIVLAVFPCLYFKDSTHEEMAKEIFNVVFFVVLSSLLVQSKTLMRLASWLNLSEAAKSKSRAPLEYEETGLSTSRMYEFEISENSPSAGLTIKELNLPENVLVYLIKRDGTFIVPRGGTIIQIDDELMMMMDPHLAPAIEPLFLASNEKSVEPA